MVFSRSAASVVCCALLALLGACARDGQFKPEPPAEAKIRSDRIGAMQEHLIASFRNQGWDVLEQTSRRLILSQPLAPQDAVRFFSRYSAGAGEATVQYEFKFQNAGERRTQVSARLLASSPAPGERVQVAEMTDKRARRELQLVLSALEKQMKEEG